MRPNKGVIKGGEEVEVVVKVKEGKEGGTKIGLKSIWLNGNFDLEDGEYLEGVSAVVTFLSSFSFFVVDVRTN